MKLYGGIVVVVYPNMQQYNNGFEFEYWVDGDQLDWYNSIALWYDEEFNQHSYGLVRKIFTFLFLGTVTLAYIYCCL